VAAGPLEDLIRKHPDTIWAELIATANVDSRFRRALRGVWVFENDGDVYARFQELMNSIEEEPN
jgi:hypothetical protein